MDSRMCKISINFSNSCHEFPTKLRKFSYKLHETVHFYQKLSWFLHIHNDDGISQFHNFTRRGKCISVSLTSDNILFD